MIRHQLVTFTKLQYVASDLKNPNHRSVYVTPNLNAKGVVASYTVLDNRKGRPKLQAFKTYYQALKYVHALPPVMQKGRK